VGKTSLFQQGKFTLHSGEQSNYKIECDALTYKDWQTLAGMIADRCKFSSVIGIPRGGIALSNQLQSYISSGPNLIVDDVWTTGGSMRPYLNNYDDIGYVIFARSPILDTRVKALFTLN
jgi:orotate phosphoribosyltransferase